MNSFPDFIKKELDLILSKNRFRSLKLPNGIDLSSNDYLCLSQNSKVKNALIAGIEFYGAGSGASRLNLGLIDTLSDPRTIIFTDRLNHASILDGIRISGAVKKYFRHKDMNHLQELLEKSDTNSRKIIVSETVFSMDGDSADVTELIRLKKEFNACLILDEAHALGVFGKEGAGVACLTLNSKYELSDIDFRVYTGGKSLGLEGSFIATSHLYKEYLINTMRTFIFSTAPIPAIAYALSTSIDLAIEMEKERTRILENARILRNGLKEIGLETLSSDSQIVPVVLYEEALAMQTASFLQEKGFDIRAIRPPTVKESRLRISVNANISKEVILQVLDCLKK